MLALPSDGSVPGPSEWRWLHTPGHTAGHVSLFRERDGLLLAGDALATVDQDSPLSMLHLHVDAPPPAPNPLPRQPLTMGLIAGGALLALRARRRA